MPRSVEGAVASRARIVSGYAVTDGVPKDLWEAWIEAHKNSAVVKNHCIFAYEKPGMGDGDAREHKEALTGLEPFQPDTDPRRPRPRNPNTGPVTRADTEAA